MQLSGIPTLEGFSPRRRNLLKSSAALIAAAGAASMTGGTSTASAQPTTAPKPSVRGLSGQRHVGFMLAHEQFTVPQLLDIGTSATKAGFSLLATSDHIQPWQANEGHAGEAWVTMGALGARIQPAWMGTTVTCPTFRYHPAVVAQAFATLSHLYPGRVFLGVGSGEALNEKAATGTWPVWQERWDRLVEAIDIVRHLWTGEPVGFAGKFYTVNAKLYDPPPQPIPLLTAANGKKSMRLAGLHGDGLITDPDTWKKHKAEWEGGAKEAGKDPSTMPVLVEKFVVVGDKDEAAKSAELWRFLPKAFKKYYNVVDPAEIQKQADAQVPLEQVMSSMAIGMDPAIHIAAVQELFDSGVTIVNVHSGQQDQQKVIDFYGRSVLPKLTG
ncbi:MAG: TIGR03557 family F420-dependent LLM class oxidoreductase [Alphaproteobacteria bacterium]|nr:TIGR03557 family F420-dependent LLM class oxidoreductase [Alphaproteobacteria bacterium]